MKEYDTLRGILDAAFNQCAYGKGAERHANGKDWTDQPIFTIAGQVGDGFNAGQAIKKIQEAHQMVQRGDRSKAQHEILGAIIYCASLYHLWEPVMAPAMPVTRPKGGPIASPGVPTAPPPMPPPSGNWEPPL